jgi:UDP:flavonoid glycosyltransferase YjiC (YdhE family)
MRVTITTGGSRGEVQPYVALGLGLRAAGHEVRIAARAPYEGFVRSRGLEFHPILETHVNSSRLSWRKVTTPLGSRDASGASWDR